MEATEIVTRKYLNTEVTEAGKQVFLDITKNVLQDVDVLQAWDSISMNDYAAMELLNNIVELWATIRCHSFAKTFNIQQEKVHKKHGTRKTLKNKGTDKENA